MTNLLQKHSEWLENRKEAVMHDAHRNKTVYLASLEVKTAMDAAEPGIIARILKETGVH